MIEKIQTGLFNYLSLLLEQYGLPVTFKYDDELDVLSEFRKSTRLRIENYNTYNTIIKRYQDESESASVHNLGLFSRTAIRRNPLMGNNAQVATLAKNLSDEYKVEVRNCYFAEMDYQVKIIFDNHESSDIFELFYGYELANKHRSFSVDYKIDDDHELLEGVPYDLIFSDIEDLGPINTSNLRQISFSIKLSGLVLTPFYKEGSLLKPINLLTYLSDGDLKIDHDLKINPLSLSVNDQINSSLKSIIRG